MRLKLNRYFFTASELNRTPALADVINSKCSKCHAPMAHFEATKDNAPIEILGNGFTSPDNPYHDRAMDGVSCTLCHQISDSPILGTPEGMSGHYPIDSYANAVDRKIYGPYANVMSNPMRMNVSYTPVYSAHTKESEMCATCHNLKTPYTDDEGNVLTTTPESEFPEQMPYSEWLASDYADTQSCQQCHMARANGVKISTRPMMLGTRDDFAEHIFVGGNRFMLDMLDNNKEELGVLATDFSEIIAGTENLLANAASIEIIDAFQTTDALEFNLRINSNTGHKLPSAYPSRRVILHVTVKDSSGATVFESGRVNADGSDEIRYSLAGLTNDDYTVTIEMVYQTLAYGFAQDLFNDNSKEVRDFKRMYNASNAKTTTIRSETFVVTP